MKFEMILWITQQESTQDASRQKSITLIGIGAGIPPLGGAQRPFSRHLSKSSVRILTKPQQVLVLSPLEEPQEPVGHFQTFSWSDFCVCFSAVTAFEYLGKHTTLWTPDPKATFRIAWNFEACIGFARNFWQSLRVLSGIQRLLILSNMPNCGHC